MKLNNYKINITSIQIKESIQLILKYSIQDTFHLTLLALFHFVFNNDKNILKKF